MPKNWLPLLLLLIASSALIALWEFSPQIQPEAVQQSDQNFPSAYLENSRTRQFDSDGALQYQLVSEHIDYYEYPDKPSANYALSRHPELTFYRQDAPPWHIRALKGHSNATGEQITFSGNVVVWQQDQQGQRTELTTEILVVNPKREYAHTEEPVKIVAPEGITRAVGMKAFLKQDRLQLLSQVKSKYESP